MEKKKDPSQMSRIAEILVAGMTETEKAALAEMARQPSDVSEAQRAKLSDLRLIEPSFDGSAMRLTKLGSQVLARLKSVVLDQNLPRGEGVRGGSQKMNP